MENKVYIVVEAIVYGDIETKVEVFNNENKAKIEYISILDKYKEENKEIKYISDCKAIVYNNKINYAIITIKEKKIN